MKNNDPLNLLIIPIAELPFSQNFVLRSKLMGFFNIQDILAQDLTSLHLLKDYSEQWYLEFTSFLQRNGLLYLMDKG